MSWVKGDRLKVTLEITAAEPSHEDVTDIWFKAGNGVGRFFFNQDDIVAAGGTVAVEVLPKPVELPTKKWAQVVFTHLGVEAIATKCPDEDCWHTISGINVPAEVIRRNYVRTLSEGVDE